MNRDMPEISTIMSAGFFILLSAVILIAMLYGQSIFVPIVIAIVIWFLINHMIDSIQRVNIAGLQMPRRLAVVIGLIILTFLAVRVSRLLYVTILDLLSQAPTYRQNLEILLQSIPSVFWDMILVSDEQEVTSNVSRLFNAAADYLSNYAASLTANVTNIVTQSLLVLIYVIFLLLEQGTFITKINNMFPNPERRAEVDAVLASIKEQVQTYFVVKTYVSLMTGLVSFLVMWLFGLEFALVWAVLIFALNFIPYIGSIIAIIFPVLMALLQFGEWSPVVAIFVLLILVQTAVGYFVEPLLMGNSLDISPFVMLVSLAIFGTIWGITGMFLSIPLIIILIVVLSHFDVTRPIAVLLSGDGVVYGVGESKAVE